jgi:hypothetical protein
MRRQAMQRGVIAVLDIGTSKDRLPVLQFDGPGGSSAKPTASGRWPGSRISG